jgi:predicted RNA binding protein YcfA (HicA-like mRNA interferase family)
MGKLPGIPHLQAVRALEKAGFRVLRQGKHIVMTNGQRILTIPLTTRSTPSQWAALFAMLG